MSEHKLGTLVIFDIASTAALLLLSLTVAFVRSSPETKDHALDEVTPILVTHIQPRRPLIFSLLTLAALTYLADGAVNVLRAVLVGAWTKPGPIGLVSYVLGLLSFSLLAIFLSWKDIHGANAWGRKRVRVFAALAVLIHVAHVILVVVTGRLKRKRYISVLPYLSDSLFTLISARTTRRYSREAVATTSVVLTIITLRYLPAPASHLDSLIPGSRVSLQDVCSSVNACSAAGRGRRGQSRSFNVPDQPCRCPVPGLIRIACAQATIWHVHAY